MGFSCDCLALDEFLHIVRLCKQRAFYARSWYANNRVAIWKEMTNKAVGCLC